MSYFVYAATSLAFPVVLQNNSYVILHTMERPVQPALLEALMNHSPLHDNKDAGLKWARSLKICNNLFYRDIRIDLIFCVSPCKPKVIGFQGYSFNSVCLVFACPPESLRLFHALTQYQPIPLCYCCFSACPTLTFPTVSTVSTHCFLALI